MDRLKVYDLRKVTAHTEVETMSKLHLSIISLGLCLILGVGSLAAQGRGRGGNKKPQTTFLVALDDQDGVGAVETGCTGEAPGSNLEARFVLADECLVVQGNNLTLSLSLISSKFTKKALSLNMFFRLLGGDERYQGDNIPAFLVPGGGDPFSGESFRIRVNETVTLRKSGQPDKGSIAFDIMVGHVVYMKVE